MATLTVTLTESVALGDGSSERGTTNVQTVDVNEVDNRIMDVTTAFTEIIKFAGTAAAGTFKDASVKYLRITNIDTSGAEITLRVQMTDSQYFVKIESEDHFILGNTVMDAHEDGDTALTTSPTFAAIDSIAAKSSSGTIQIEIFVASRD